MTQAQLFTDSPESIAKEDARAWIRVFGDTPDSLRCTCKHGHTECSTTKGGECFDEMLQAGIVNV